MKKWESEKHKVWGVLADEFKGHVATDGSLLGTAGKRGACGWSVLQLDDDEELRPLHGVYGSTKAKFEVQRTIKRAKLTAFLCFLKKVIGPIKVHVGNKGIGDGLWKAEMKCIDPKAGDADLWINIREELHHPISRDIVVEVEHVKAHRTKKDKREMSQFERSLSLRATRKRMSWQRQEQCWTKDLWRGSKSKDSAARKRKVFSALQYAASFHCLVEEW